MTTHPGPKCGAKTRAGGVCGQAAGRGTDHPGIGPCKLHGGSMTVHRQRARRIALEQAARDAGVPSGRDPAEGLLEELEHTRGELEWLRALIIAEIEAGGGSSDGVFRGTMLIREVSGPDGTTVTNEVGPRLSERMRAYERWKNLYVRQVGVALAHGLAERQIEIAERNAETLGQLVAVALDAAGIHGEARVSAIAAARERFVLLHGGVG